jgi:glycosyltransferase involved in cell wall biosynthesis
VNAAKVRYIPNGIDLRVWDRLQQAPNPLAFDRYPGSLQVGVIGRLVPQKNHVLFLRAFARALEANGPQRWHAWLLGAQSRSQSTAEEVTRTIKVLGLGDQVSLVEAQPAIAAILHALDLVVLSSDFEGFPNVALEAMATGTPLIATSVGDIPQLMGPAAGATAAAGRVATNRPAVERAAGGLVVPPGDEEALAEAMLTFGEASAADRQHMGASGRARVEASYRMEHVADQYLELYRDVATT